MFKAGSDLRSEIRDISIVMASLECGPSMTYWNT